MASHKRINDDGVEQPWTYKAVGAQLKLAQMPRNGAKVRVRNRCEVSGRPRAFYRRFRISRVALRDLASNGQLPGVVKSSW